ncbi:exodeoxyribonuclease VII small subunit [Candidatus Desantisbacteria bacterium]|nr:exodeoxyribonuclease VII small subunit [Candidatus Desantisbacteria bacterium]
MTQQKNKSFKFEDGLTKLEEIVNKLESGNLSLDDSLKYFEEGISLSRLCTQKLNEVEKKIEIITKNKNGDLEAKSFMENENVDLNKDKFKIDDKDVAKAQENLFDLEK